MGYLVSRELLTQPILGQGQVTSHRYAIFSITLFPCCQMPSISVLSLEWQAELHHVQITLTFIPFQQEAVRAVPGTILCILEASAVQVVAAAAPVLIGGHRIITEPSPQPHVCITGVFELTDFNNGAATRTWLEDSEKNDKNCITDSRDWVTALIILICCEQIGNSTGVWVRLQVLQSESMKMTVFSDTASCSLPQSKYWLWNGLKPTFADSMRIIQCSEVTCGRWTPSRIKHVQFDHRMFYKEGSSAACCCRSHLAILKIACVEDDRRNGCALRE
jgi:hypothetical protein